MTGAIAAAQPEHDPQLAAFYRRHFDFVWRNLARLGVAPSDLEDAAHEVFVIVQRRWSEVQSMTSPRAWVYGTSRRVAANWRRSRERRGRFEQRLIHETGPGHVEDADRLVQVREAQQTLTAFLRTLDVGKRQVFVLAEIEQLTAPEISVALGLKLNTVYSRLRTVRAAFAEWLQQGHDAKLELQTDDAPSAARTRVWGLLCGSPVAGGNTSSLWGWLQATWAKLGAASSAAVSTPGAVAIGFATVMATGFIATQPVESSDPVASPVAAVPARSSNSTRPVASTPDIPSDLSLSTVSNNIAVEPAASPTTTSAPTHRSETQPRTRPSTPRDNNRKRNRASTPPAASASPEIDSSPPASTLARETATLRRTRELFAARDWAATQQEAAAYLEQFPEGLYRQEIHTLIEATQRETQAAASTPRGVAAPSEPPVSRTDGDRATVAKQRAPNDGPQLLKPRASPPDGNSALRTPKGL